MAENTHQVPVGTSPCSFKEVPWDKKVFFPREGKWYTKTRELNPQGNPIGNAKQQGGYGTHIINIPDKAQVFIEN